MEIKRVVVISADYCLKLATDILKQQHDEHGEPGDYSPDLKLMIATQETLREILEQKPPEVDKTVPGKIVITDAPGSACGETGRIEA